MPISGLWKNAVAYESGAKKWGTGINPIHGVSTMGEPLRQAEIVHPYGPGDPAPPIDPSILDPGLYSDWGYVDEDFSAEVWGYGPETGTSERPAPTGDPLVPVTTSLRSNADDFPPFGPVAPAYGPTSTQTPGGKNIRALSKGGLLPRFLKLGFKSGTVGDGWENKKVSGVDDSGISDPSQYVMQTSMIQRDKVREGSQAQPGRASEYLAPIGSYRPTWGQRMKLWSGTPQGRHYDMYPFQAEELIRPFRNRTAGTGYAEWLAANEAFNYQVSPLERQPVPDPSTGNQIPVPGNVYDEEESNVQTWVNTWY